ncbi:hypothetical protein [Micromonospora sp. NPDC005367]|uniref:hypothetical protein n=1 Tax=Micromonospora sp. NPDC005367 TaxID=3155590 RepID=UPI0033B48CBE
MASGSCTKGATPLNTQLDDAPEHLAGAEIPRPRRDGLPARAWRNLRAKPGSMVRREAS